MIIPAKEQTSAAVAQHYDDLDRFYRELWGDHVHHGLWTTGLENPAQAVENLIACVARRLELDPGQHVCDVGCGYGATAQWLAEHHGVHVTGLTISAVQAQRASERATGSSQLRFLWRDWLDNGCETGSFDHIVAIESFEDLSLRVRRTWGVCAARLARKLLVNRSYRRFLRDARAGNRIFALTLLRIWAAYQTGSMRYGLLVARNSTRRPASGQVP